MKINYSVVVFLLVAIAGCKDHSGDKFLGHWDAVNQHAKDYIDIKEGGETYHFDHTFRTVALVGIAYDVEKFEGTPISDDVLRLGGVAGSDVRLENGILYFRGSEYAKSK